MGETGEGQRKEKTMLDYKVLRTRCHRGAGFLDRGTGLSLGRGQPLPLEHASALGAAVRALQGKAVLPPPILPLE